MTEEVPIPLPRLTEREKLIISRLNPNQRQAIDKALMGAVTQRWSKVAMVVARAMRRSTHVSGVPDTFYGLRVGALVKAKRIEAQGRVEFMRFSEVRLWPAKSQEVHRVA
jgi:hypothetical protein